MRNAPTNQMKHTTKPNIEWPLFRIQDKTEVTNSTTTTGKLASRTSFHHTKPQEPTEIAFGIANMTTAIAKEKTSTVHRHRQTHRGPHLLESAVLSTFVIVRFRRAPSITFASPIACCANANTIASPHCRCPERQTSSKLFGSASAIHPGQFFLWHCHRRERTQRTLQWSIASPSQSDLRYLLTYKQ